MDATTDAPRPTRVDLPLQPGWSDRTMIVHSAPPRAGSQAAANIVVARDALGAGESFPGYCARQDALFRRQLPGFTPEGERAGELHGHPAAQRLFTWTSGAGSLRQQVSFIDAGDGLVVTVTATAAVDEWDEHLASFNAALAGLVIGDRG